MNVAMLVAMPEHGDIKYVYKTVKINNKKLPKNVKEAMKDKGWQAAIEKELANFETLKVFKLVPYESWMRVLKTH